MSFAPLKMRMAERLGDNFLPFTWCSQKPRFLEELLWWVCITAVKRITEGWLQNRLGWVFEREYKQRIFIFFLNNKTEEMGFAQAPCPNPALIWAKGQTPTNFHGRNLANVGEKNPAKLAREHKKLLWAVKWETTSMHGGHLRPRWTFQAKPGAYLYNHVRKCNLCFLHSRSLSCMGIKQRAEMGLMLFNHNPVALQGCSTQGLSPESHPPTSPLPQCHQ